MAGDVIIETRGLTKEFAGFLAVDKVDLRVRKGQIHAIIGPNGAGKTTFFNLLTKFLAPSGGQILFNGQDITFEKPAHVARRGIIRSFQISAVFPHLTVLENVKVGLQRRLGTACHFWKPGSSLAVLDARALELLEAMDLAPFASTLAVQLPYGRKRALEIRDHARHGARSHAAGRADPGHGPRRCGAHHRPHQEDRGQSHRAHGGAQYEGRGRDRRHDHGFPARAGHRRRRLRVGIEETRW